MHQGNHNYYAHKSVCTGDFVLFINTSVEPNKYILFSRQVVATAGLGSFCQKRLTQLQRSTVKKAKRNRRGDYSCTSCFESLAMDVVKFLLPTSASTLIGLFFNIRMILGCFRKKTSPQPQKYSAVVALQFVYHVAILTMNTVEVWQGFEEKPENFCNVFKALMISVNVLQLFNIITVCLICCSPDAVADRQFFHFAVTASSTALGLLACILCVWYTCSNFLDFLYRASIAGLLFSLIAAFLLCVTTPIFPWCSQKSFVLESPQEKMFFAENKKTAIFCAIMFLCFGVPLVFYVRPDLVSDLRLTKFICLLTMNLIVGIIMPVTFSALTTELSYTETHDRNGSKGLSIVQVVA